MLGSCQCTPMLSFEPMIPQCMGNKLTHSSTCAQVRGRGRGRGGFRGGGGFRGRGYGGYPYGGGGYG
jgi:hypothetical protein